MSERRRVPRRAFGGVAEITELYSGKYMVAPTAELSRYGSFVTTNVSMPVGTKISLLIHFDESVFNASGEIVYILPYKGMGIRFTTTAPEDVTLLETWLKEQTKF